MEADVELSNVIVCQRHFVVAHKELHDVSLYSLAGRGHPEGDVLKRKKGMDRRWRARALFSS